MNPVVRETDPQTRTPAVATREGNEAAVPLGSTAAVPLGRHLARMPRHSLGVLPIILALPLPAST